MAIKPHLNGDNQQLKKNPINKTHINSNPKSKPPNDLIPTTLVELRQRPIIELGFCIRVGGLEGNEKSNDLVF
jgi:hypothetical protein